MVRSHKRPSKKDSPDLHWRNKAHKMFDPLWKSDLFISRDAAYFWLANKMQMPLHMCHFRFMTEEQCKKAIKLMKGLIKESE